MIFIDIHTHHRKTNTSNTFSIRNIVLSNDELPMNETVSAGWHPWFIANYRLTEIEAILIEAAKTNNVVTIGECGIDRSVEVPFDFQCEVFTCHIIAALNTNKPLIIHCVKAYSDIIGLLKKNRFKNPVIFHAYNGNAVQTKQLLTLNSYFSIGDLSKMPKIKAEKLLCSIPVDRIFFETDDSQLSIENIYLQVSEILQHDIEMLKKQVLTNFITVFGDKLLNPKSL